MADAKPTKPILEYVKEIHLLLLDAAKDVLALKNEDFNLEIHMPDTGHIGEKDEAYKKLARNIFKMALQLSGQVLCEVNISENICKLMLFNDDGSQVPAFKGGFAVAEAINKTIPEMIANGGCFDQNEVCKPTVIKTRSARKDEFRFTSPASNGTGMQTFYSSSAVKALRKFLPECTYLLNDYFALPITRLNDFAELLGFDPQMTRDAVRLNRESRLK